MQEAIHAQLADALWERRESIADQWVQAVKHAGYVPLSIDKVRQRLLQLTDRALALLTAEVFDEWEAREIGTALAAMHYLQPEALGRTLGVLSDALCAGLPADSVNVLEPRLAKLVEGVATGFVGKAFQVILAEQEEIRNALVSELRVAQAALIDARDQLELRVEERVAELERANEALRIEILERERAERGQLEALEEALRSKKALQESEAKYRLLLETAQDGVFTLDLEGRFTFVNDVIVNRSGYPREWFLGRSGLDTIRPEDKAHTQRYVEAVMRGESVPIFEVAYPTASGELMWVELNTAALREGVRVAGIHGVSRNITERKRAEMALRESEERWRSLVENAPDLVMTVDREGRIQFVNRILWRPDLSMDQIVGSLAVDYALPEQREIVVQAMQTAFEAGENTRFEAATVNPDGKEAWFAVHVGPVRSSGQISSAVMLIRDITERRKFEEVKDNLIRDVSHELRTPLAKMHMSLELLLEMLAAEELDRAKVTKLGDRAFGNVQRLLQTVEAILDLSSLEAGLKPYRWEEINIETLVQDVSEEMEPLAAAQGLELVQVLPPYRLGIEGDYGWLFRVLANLIENAVKFSEEGQIVVSAECKDSMAEICVRDAGRGILAENLDRVFERFFREKTHYQGVGVGLTICRSIVEAHGGRIWAESPGRGKGAAFHVALPMD